MAQSLLFVAVFAVASVYLSSAQDGLPTMLKTLHTWPAWENNVVSVSYPRSGYGYYNNNYYNNGYSPYSSYYNYNSYGPSSGYYNNGYGSYNNGGYYGNYYNNYYYGKK